MASPDTAQRLRHLTHCGPRAGRLDGKGHQVGGSCRGFRQGIQRCGHPGGVTFAPNVPEAGDLLRAHLAVVDAADIHLFTAVCPGWRLVAVHPDNLAAARIDLRLRGCRHLLDAKLWHAGLDGGGHATKRFHLGNMATGAAHQPLGQLFQKVGATKRVDDMRHVGLTLKMQLRVAGDARRMVGWQPQRLVKRIGVK